MVKFGLMSYFLTPASKPKLNNPDENHDAIRCLNFARALGPNGITQTALNILPH